MEGHWPRKKVNKLIFKKKSGHRLPWKIAVEVRKMATGLDLDVGHDLQQQIITVVTLTLTYRKL
jgi:hypothetical protein